ncbi:MAG: DUF4837 family protein [Rikenellaceae bacterium]|nr:DUF4837 family protein [Rikenellaceae bacterium]
MGYKLKVIIAVVLCSTLFSCKERTGYLPEPTGKYYDVIAVASEKIWDGPAGNTLRSIMREEIPMLNQREPLYDLYNTVPRDFKGLLLRHRNLIRFNISPQISEPSMTAEYDVYAQPQLIVDINGPSEAQVASYMDEHRKELQRIFDIAERDRIVDWAAKYGEERISNEIENKFGFTMSILRGAKIRNNNIPDFTWISLEHPLASQGIVIYTYPMEEKEIYLPSLVYHRNEFVKNIPGPSDGSYMTTSSYISPILSAFDISGRRWYEMRGFWDVENDYMGGPFVNYSTIDKENNRIISIDFYVYSPKHNKRNYIRQLENLIFTVEI